MRHPWCRISLFIPAPSEQTFERTFERTSNRTCIRTPVAVFVATTKNGKFRLVSR